MCVASTETGQVSETCPVCLGVALAYRVWGALPFCLLGQAWAAGKAIGDCVESECDV